LRARRAGGTGLAHSSGLNQDLLNRQLNASQAVDSHDIANGISSAPINPLDLSGLSAINEQVNYQPAARTCLGSSSQVDWLTIEQASAWSRNQQRIDRI
jgi:hypothetical protein